MSARKPSSGQHPAVREFRRKLDSIGDGVLEDLEALNRELDEQIKRSSRPPKDPRRDGDSDPPVDIVTPEKKP